MEDQKNHKNHKEDHKKTEQLTTISNETLLSELIQKAKINIDNAKQEIKIHTLNLIESHWFDNLLSLIENATSRGYFAAEWIDFWGVSSIDPNIIIGWAYDAIKNQGLKEVIEPYYNNVNNRLGIILNRSILEQNKIDNDTPFLTLSMELRELQER
jgi:hypothetical protein